MNMIKVKIKQVFFVKKAILGSFVTQTKKTFLPFFFYFFKALIVELIVLVY